MRNLHNCCVFISGIGDSLSIKMRLAVRTKFISYLRIIAHEGYCMTGSVIF